LSRARRWELFDPQHQPKVLLAQRNISRHGANKLPAGRPAIDHGFRWWLGRLLARHPEQPGAQVPKKRLPEGWLLSTSGSAPRLKQPLKTDWWQTHAIKHKTAVTITLGKGRVNWDL